MTVYVFDMDATLTPPRLPMTEAFAQRFFPWQLTHTSYVATGSDFKKVKEQLPEKVIDAFAGIYCSMGNVFVSKGKEVYRKEFDAPSQLIVDLERFVQLTKYPGKIFPNHIETRIGMLNFSVLGRNCPYDDRNKYSAWDKVAQERLAIQKNLMDKYPALEITLGGAISVDITPKGCGKGQIAHHLRNKYPSEKIIFLGDRTMPGGNDYELASELSKYDNTSIIQVEGPEEILRILGV